MLGAALALTLALTGTAYSAPLAGTGVNIEPVATLEIDDSQKNELEMAGDYAYVDYDDGMDIVDISDPTNPKTVGELKCKGSGGDIDISPDATFAVRATAHGTPCKGAGTAATIVDIRDKKNPKILAKIDLDPDKVIDYVHTVTLDNNILYLNPQTAAFYPNQQPEIRVFDVSNPAKPVDKGSVAFTPGVQAVAHDSFVDHRPDGTDLLYAASIHTTDVYNVDVPWEATMKQRTTQPDMTISHQAQPNWDRSLIIVADESAAGDSAGGFACGKAGTGPAAVDAGSVHFFAAAEDGTFANGGVNAVGSYNKEYRRTANYCTAHVFWPAPDQNRITQAWYSEGARIIDFSDPANPTEIGSFVADKPTLYWSVKPHRGYLFATDMDRGLDVLRYTGEGGKKWPATSGPAEIQRSQWQGVPYVPLKGVSRGGGLLPGATKGPSGGGTGGPGTQPGGTQNNAAGGFARAIGRIRLNLKVKGLSKRRRNVLRLTFFDAKGKKVGKTVRIKKRGSKRGRTTRIRVRGTAVAGKYRFVLRSHLEGQKRTRSRVVKRGRFTVKPRANAKLSQPHTIYARMR